MPKNLSKSPPKKKKKSEAVPVKEEVASPGSVKKQKKNTDSASKKKVTTSPIKKRGASIDASAKEKKASGKKVAFGKKTASGKKVSAGKKVASGKKAGSAGIKKQKAAPATAPSSKKKQYQKKKTVATASQQKKSAGSKRSSPGAKAKGKKVKTPDGSAKKNRLVAALKKTPTGTLGDICKTGNQMHWIRTACGAVVTWFEKIKDPTTPGFVPFVLKKAQNDTKFRTEHSIVGVLDRRESVSSDEKIMADEKYSWKAIVLTLGTGMSKDKVKEHMVKFVNAVDKETMKKNGKTKFQTRTHLGEDKTPEDGPLALDNYILDAEVMNYLLVVAYHGLDPIDYAGDNDIMKLFFTDPARGRVVLGVDAEFHFLDDIDVEPSVKEEDSSEERETDEESVSEIESKDEESEASAEEIEAEESKAEEYEEEEFEEEESVEEEFEQEEEEEEEELEESEEEQSEMESKVEQSEEEVFEDEMSDNEV